MKLYFGSDHGGVEMRAALEGFVIELAHEVAEVYGPASSQESADYPDVARQTCLALLSSDEPALGILVCGTGQGMAMAANKLAGIRAGVVGDTFSAKMIRQHNDANVICLGQRVLGIEVAKTLLETYINSEFDGGRHVGRVAKITSMNDKVEAE